MASVLFAESDPFFEECFGALLISPIRYIEHVIEQTTPYSTHDALLRVRWPGNKEFYLDS